MHFPKEPGADGQRLQAAESGLHGAEVVDDLLDVGAERLVIRLGVVDLEE